MPALTYSSAAGNYFFKKKIIITDLTKIEVNVYPEIEYFLGIEDSKKTTNCLLCFKH